MRRQSRQSAPTRQPRSGGSEQSFAFRRSRTITGSAATTVRAAGEGRGQLQSPRLHEHSLRKHRRKLVAFLGLSLLVAGGLWYIVSSYLGNTIQVATASTQATRSPLDTVRYQGLVKEYFSSRPFERFGFALDENEFTQFMRSRALELADATLERGDGLGTTQLEVQLREPIVAWTIKNQQYFVDASGSAFTVNYFAVPTVIVTDKSGISAEAGVIASSKLLRFIGRVITLVNASDIAPVESVELPPSSTREVDFKLRGLGYTIKTHLDRDPAGQAADVINAVRYVESQAIKPQYLDVRVSSKAFYRDVR